MEFVGMVWVATAAVAIIIAVISIFVARNEKKSRKIDAKVYEHRIESILEQKKAFVDSADKNAEAFYEEVSKSIDKEKRALDAELKFNTLAEKYGKVSIENENLIGEVVRWKDTAQKNLSQRKSSEVRTGKIAENIAPFLDDYPYDPEDSRFLGSPIDIVVFDDEGIHLVEVKSGKSQLSQKQRKIRDLVDEGKVTFEVFRVVEKE